MAPIDLWYALAAVTVLCFIVKWVQSFNSERQFRRFVRDHGAELPKIAPYKLPFAIDRLWRLITTARRGGDIFDDIFVKGHRDHGRTFVNVGLAGQGILTCEPRKVQGILANQFDGFFIRPKRKAQFGVL